MRAIINPPKPRPIWKHSGKYVSHEIDRCPECKQGRLWGKLQPREITSGSIPCGLFGGKSIPITKTIFTPRYWTCDNCGHQVTTHYLEIVLGREIRDISAD